MAQEGAELYGDTPTRRFFGEIAKLEAQNRASYSPEDFHYFDGMNIAVRDEFDAFLNTLDTSRPLTAIDFGCGLGVHARYVANNFNTTVHALDYSPHLTEVDRRINKLCKLDDKVLPFDSDAIAIDLEGRDLVGKCDFVYSIQAMLFVTDKKTLFRKCNRALKMGGKLYFEDLLVNKRIQPTDYETESLVALHMADFLDPWEYIKYLEEAGFRVDQYEDRTKEKNLRCFEISTIYLSLRESIVEEYGQEVYDGRPGYYVDQFSKKTLRKIGLSVEEVRERFPLLFNHYGEEWIRDCVVGGPNEQYIIIPKFIATKVAEV